MLVLGLEGGLALHGKFELSMLRILISIAAVGFIIPLICYPILSRTKSVNLIFPSYRAHDKSSCLGTGRLIS